MENYCVIVTARSFAKADPAPLNLLLEAGCEVIRLPLEGNGQSVGGRGAADGMGDGAASGAASGGGDLRAQLEEYLPKADAVIAGLEVYDRSLLEKCPKLKIISRYGVGYDKIDVECARERGIAVSITPGANGDSVADLAVALMLAAARHVPRMDASIRGGGQERPTGVEMWKKTLGVLGTGRIGKGVIQRASGFQMKVLCSDKYPDEEFAKKNGAVYADLETILRECDFISIHSPLTEETQNMFNAEAFQKMKPRAVLVNTARGGIVDEEALYHALKNGWIGAAALDATVVEPPKDSPLCALPNCILTPHAGAATYEAGYNMGMMAAKNALDMLLAGSCGNLV